jgi:hypothetical protein
MERLCSVTSKKPTEEQHKRFIETARQLECDEDKERFEANMKRIAKAKPGTSAPAKTKPR